MQKENIFEFIENQINSNDIVLFMKGDSNFPQCGFSALVVNILIKHKVSFKDINVLMDQDLREGIKKFTDWPTIPQLYIKGEFIGGCDIVKEMYQSGDFIALLQEKNIPHE
jgi:monothiol glutaredoxin